MQVLHNPIGYKQDPTKHFHFDDYAAICGDFVLLEGGFVKPSYWKVYNLTPKELSRIKSKKTVRLDFAEPTNFLVGDYPQTYDHEFYKVLTLCPYTAEWLNKKYGEKKNIPIFFPIHERYISPKRKKTIDILYSGHILSRELRNELLLLKNFNYAVISNSKDRLVTHRSVSYEEKMKLYAQSKITLVHNFLFKPYIHWIINIWRSGDYWNNEAFKQIPPPWKPWELLTKNFYIPQLKSRTFEAAVSKSLILCRKDEFNVIERFFEPGKEFIYYEPGNLEATIQHVLSNYSKYTGIAERAYNRAIKQYTVKAFVKKYLMDIGHE